MVDVVAERPGRLREFWFYSFRTGDHEWLMGCHSSIPHYRILEALDAMGSDKAGPIGANGVIPKGPDLGLDRPHDRDRFAAAA